MIDGVDEYQEYKKSGKVLRLIGLISEDLVGQPGNDRETIIENFHKVITRSLSITITRLWRMIKVYSKFFSVFYFKIMFENYK